MRTTVTLDDDTAAAVEHLRRQHHIGVSAAVNQLVRQGLATLVSAPAFVQRSSSGHALQDVTNVAEVLADLDRP